MKKLHTFKCEWVDGEVKIRATFSILNNELLLDTVRKGGRTNGTEFRKWVTIYDRYLPDLSKNAVQPLSAVQLQDALDRYKQTIFITVQENNT